MQNREQISHLLEKKIISEDTFCQDLHFSKNLEANGYTSVITLYYGFYAWGGLRFELCVWSCGITAFGVIGGDISPH